MSDHLILGGMDQLTAIRVFVRIVETGSITKAAASLEMPKSTASKFLAELEKHLNTKLLLRSTRSISITDEGAEYYQEVSGVIAKLSEADLSITQRSTGPRGRVRVDAPSAIAHTILIPALAEFRNRYPHIQLAIGISDRPVGLVEEAVDCVIRLGELPDASLISKTLFQDRLLTCASPEYLEAFGIPETPGDLDKDHTLIGYFSAASGGSKALLFQKGSKKMDFKSTHILTNDSAGHTRMLLSGLGIGQAYHSVVKEHIVSGRLQPILENWTNVTMPISILYPASKQLSIRTRSFIDWVTDLMRDQGAKQL